jgi:biopolymer transport protein ExbD
MAIVRARPFPEPISTINITPMIDVMLVLLVMLILTIPMKVHKVAIDLPSPIPVAASSVPHRLAIARDGALSWDGRAVRDAELPGLLDGVARNKAQVLHVQTDPEASYERFDQTLAVVKRANVQRLAFVGAPPFTDF